MLILCFLKVIQRQSSEAEISLTVISKYKWANILGNGQLSFLNFLVIETQLGQQDFNNWRNKQWTVTTFLFLKRLEIANTSSNRP